MRYFKKLIKRDVLLSTGAYLHFDPVDSRTFVLATNRPDIIRELEVCMREQRGAIENISEADYNTLLSKKNSSQTPPKPWREELANHAWHRAEGSPTSVGAGVAAAEAAAEKVLPTKPEPPPDLTDIPRPSASR